jgi:hypothetical protein
MDSKLYTKTNEFLMMSDADMEDGRRMKHKAGIGGGIFCSFDKDLADKKWLNKFVKKLNKCFNTTPKELKWLDVSEAKGACCLCHANCRKASLFLGDDYERVKGYNLSHSPDGRMVSAEIHSVVKHIPSGELYDFTQDYDDRTTGKWFLECDAITKYHQPHFKEIWGDTRILDFIKNKKSHHCSKSGIEFGNYLDDTILLSDLEQYLDEDLEFHKKLIGVEERDDDIMFSLSKKQIENISLGTNKLVRIQPEQLDYSFGIQVL